MDKLKDFEERAEKLRPLFFQIYALLEKLNKDKDYLISGFKEKTPTEIYKVLAPVLTKPEFIEEGKDDVDKAKQTLELMAVEIAIFCIYGPGKAEKAWSDQLEANRLNMQGGEA